MVPDNAPAGSNQTVVDGSDPAHYIHSDTTTFTRVVDVLPEGHRLENGVAVYWSGYQLAARCDIGEHSFNTNGTLK
jgi:hypothetical protein